MRIILFTLLTGVLLSVSSVPAFAGCAVNLKITNAYAPTSGTIVWVWFKDHRSRVKENSGSFWNSLCGSGDKCTCLPYTSIYAGRDYTCSTRLENSCNSGDRDFDLIYDEGSSEANKWVTGAVKSKRNVEISEGKTITFAWP